MTDDTLTISGGAGGVTAGYDDMLTCAGLLERLVSSLADRAGDVTLLARDHDLLESAVLAPGTAARVAELALAATAGPHGLLPAAARFGATAVTLRASVVAYQAADRALAAMVTVYQQAAAVPTLLGGDLPGLLPRLAWDLQTGDWTDLQRLPGLAMDDLGANLYANPWIVDGIIDDGPLLMQVLSGGMTAVAGPGPTMLLNWWTTSQEGSPFPPATLEQAAGDVIAFGEAFGYFESGTPSATPRGDAHPPGADVPLPNGVEGLLTGVNQMGGGANKSGVRVLSVVGADGVRRWIVEIPGTQEWSPTAGSNPIDLTNNLRLMAGQQTEQNEAIRRAMDQAGIPPDEQVMLVGHSQGGITAASLAADPATRQRYQITDVVTAGSPVARFPIPDDVHVLSLEHNQDAVPRLDGQPNPDRPNWTTVHRDPTGLIGSGGEPVDSTGSSHFGGVYAQTGHLVDTSGDPALAAAKADLAPFLTDDPNAVTVQDFTVTRNP